MRSLVNLIVFLLGIIAIVFFPIFISLTFLSMLIVPLTWAYAQLTGISYNRLIDQSDMLYKLNIFGQWALLIGGAIFLFSLLFV